MLRWFIFAAALACCTSTQADDWHDPYCAYGYGCDKESRFCRCRPFCPRGYCGFVDTGCLRVDYAAYVLKKEDLGGTPISSQYYPRYERRCRDCWLRDLAPCAHLPH